MCLLIKAQKADLYFRNSSPCGNGAISNAVAAARSDGVGVIHVAP